MATPTVEDAVTRRFPASRAAAGLARDLLAGALRRWNLPHLVPDGTLIVGELVANAVGASRCDEIVKVHAGLRPGEVVIAVWDGAAGRPVTKNVDLTLETLDLSPENFDANGGWGCAIVTALARRCWTEPTAPAGKWVCAALAR